MFYILYCPELNGFPSAYNVSTLPRW